MNRLDELFLQMISYYSGEPKQIQHFTKVHNFARLIGRQENLDERTQEILEAAAYVHDIGIKPALEKYGSSVGKFQEKEGPEPAGKLLAGLGFDPELIERVCYLVAHHHTYNNMDGLDYQILVEADFLVNLYEKDMTLESIGAACENVFRTKAGTGLCKTMFGL